MASVKPKGRQRASTMSSTGRSSSANTCRAVLGAQGAEERLRPRFRSGSAERVDVDLEVTRADGHVDAIAVATRLVSVRATDDSLTP